MKVVGTSFEEHDRDSFVEFAAQGLGGVRHEFTEEGGPTTPSGSTGPRAPPEDLKPRPSRRRDRDRLKQQNLLHYLSVPPQARHGRVAHAARSGTGGEHPGDHGEAVRHRSGQRQALNAAVHQVFAEEQIFRIDHFLGKEAALNILAFRFANGLFEPTWNRNFIDHIQIDVPEQLGLDQRASFYEATGAYRDMVVTHLFQVMAFTAMEAPTALEPKSITEEKNKVFRSMLPITTEDVVRGQYTGYRRYRRRAESETETFIALRCYIDNWRWAGRAVLPTNRQEDGRGPADHLDRIQGAPAVDVPRGLRHR